MTAATQSRTIVGPTTPLDAALWALDEGLWPVCITPWDDPRSKSPGKAPIGKAWGVERPDRASLEATYRHHPKAGVGLKLGAEGRVVDLDIDDPDQAGPVLARLFPDGLPETARWENAAGRFHLLFRYDDRLANLGKSIIKGVPLSSDQERTLSPLGAPWSDGTGSPRSCDNDESRVLRPLVFQQRHRARRGRFL
jgi:Bifunctional DNA primase/polymerase, N-terminal